MTNPIETGPTHQALASYLAIIHTDVLLLGKQIEALETRLDAHLEAVIKVLDVISTAIEQAESKGMAASGIVQVWRAQRRGGRKQEQEMDTHGAGINLTPESGG